MAEFIIAATYGDIAQLGERLNGIQEVVGSIPIISTKLIKQGKSPCFFYLRIFTFQTLKGKNSAIIKGAIYKTINR